MELDRFEWLALRREKAVDPERRIVDAHHHLWDRGGSTYLAPQLLEDMTGTHNVVKERVRGLHGELRPRARAAHAAGG